MVKRLAAQKPGGSLERLTPRRGASTIVTLVILVPVLFAFMGFAVDLGMMYSVKGELKAAANAMALAAAGQLIGTSMSTSNANAAARLTIESSTGFGNKYYFHGFPIGQGVGSLTSNVTDPAFFDTLQSALAGGSGDVDGSLARHVRITVDGQIQRLFWGFMPPIFGTNLTVAATAVAGISPPLCLACGIEPFAIAAIDQSDTTNFGFTADTKYSMTFLCTRGNGMNPTALAGAAQILNYLLLNRYDLTTATFSDEGTQAFRDGAGGLPGSTNPAQACFRVNNPEVIWASATVSGCTAARVAPVVTDALCGLDTRFESTTPDACANIPNIGELTAYQADTDVNDYDSYLDYTGNGRRTITIPVVDALNAGGNMTVLGFRQFLLIPNQGAANITPNDSYGRFIAMYIGSVAPLRQGRFDGCNLQAGPGKVVLHQ